MSDSKHWTEHWTAKYEKKQEQELRKLLRAKEGESLLAAARRMNGTLVAIEGSLDTLDAVSNVIGRMSGESVEDAAARVMDELKQFRLEDIKF